MDYIDEVQDWVSHVVDYGSRHMKLFTARRALDTGDEQDFTFQIDREMTIGYQYSTTTSDFHSNTFIPTMSSLLLLSDGQACNGWDTLLEMRRVSVYEVHGFWMFVAWMPLGFVLIATKRYLKGNWKLWHVLHLLAGLIVLFITVWQSLEVSWAFGFGWTDDVHSILGLIVIVATLISVLSGTIVAAVMRCYNGDKEWSPKERAAFLGKIHKWSSYFVLFLGNVVILGGTITYCLTYLKELKFLPIGIMSFLFFVNLVLVSEYLHRKTARSENLARQQREE